MPQQSMSLALAAATELGYSREKLQLIKDTIAQGATDDELALFLYAAQRTGLDPFSKQIYCIKRYDPGVGRDVAKPQTGIDGYRLVADRTGDYMPGQAATFEYDQNGALFSATAYVKKWRHGEWHEIAATAHYAEYVQTKKDGNPNSMWKRAPHVMLAKCAEALALRRAFPAELSGVYTSDELGDEQPAALPAKAQPMIKDVTPPAVTGIVMDEEELSPDKQRRAKLINGVRKLMNDYADLADKFSPNLDTDFDRLTEDQIIAIGKVERDRYNKELLLIDAPKEKVDTSEENEPGAVYDPATSIVA